jgi:hypothetical protein
MLSDVQKQVLAELAITMARDPALTPQEAVYMAADFACPGRLGPTGRGKAAFVLDTNTTVLSMLKIYNKAYEKKADFWPEPKL